MRVVIGFGAVCQAATAGIVGAERGAGLQGHDQLVGTDVWDGWFTLPPRIDQTMPPPISSKPTLPTASGTGRCHTRSSLVAIVANIDVNVGLWAKQLT